MVKKIVYLVFSFLFFVLPISARNIHVKGRVVAASDKEPIIGASISIKGTSVGTISDIGGNFTLNNVPDSTSVLVISYLGFTSQEIKIKPLIYVELATAVKETEEVVVVAYGTQKRRELTGAITSLPSFLLEKTNASTLDNLLSGTIAGLNVTKTSGQPGAGSTFRIRGGTSVDASNNPLYVIDGFLFYRDASSSKTGIGEMDSSIDPMSFVNPMDIESVEVLKDASATAIYGSRGANGVIIVTTKKGKPDKVSINYRSSAGVTNVSKKLDMLNANQWAQFQKDYFNNKGNYTDEQIANLGNGTDWQSAMFRSALVQNHQLSFSGNGEKTRYLLSANYIDQQGILLNTGFKRYNLRFNFDTQLLDNLMASFSITYGKSTQEGLTTTESKNFNSSPYSAGITNSLTYALLMPPVISIYKSSGSYNYTNPYEYAYFSLNNKAVNPISDLENSVAESINNSSLSNLSLRYAITKELVANFRVGNDVSNITQNFFAPSTSAIGLQDVGIGAIGTKHYESWQTEYTLGYTKRFNDIHFLDVLVGYTYQNTSVNFLDVTTTHFTNEDLKYNNLKDGSEPYNPASGSSKSTLKSLIGRLNYTLLGRYNLTTTFRADNSSRFAANHRWGYFPSIGLSWNINEEKFMSKLKKLSNLKLRLSAGTIGNQEIGDYEYSQNYSAGTYNGSASYTKTNEGDSNLKWETTAQYNIGLDAGFFKSRLNVVADVYYKKTSDLLLEVPADPTTGVSTQLKNIGNVVNKGIEFSANAVLIDRKNLFWNTTATFSTNNNKITSMGSTKRLFQGDTSEMILKPGESLGSFYGLIFDGIVQLNEDVSQLPITSLGTPSPGDVKFVDVKKDGKIDENDRTVLGSIQPKFTYAFSSSFNYRKIDLLVSFQGSYGNKVYNSLRRTLEHPTDSYNVSTALLDSWTKTNPSQTQPYCNGVRAYSYIDSRYVENASYLKLKDITLGYTIKPKFKSLGVQTRFFASAQNLFAITKYKGYDPEVSGGVDNGTYPASRTFLFGLSLSY